MIIVGILLCIAGLGALCWLLFNLAVFALPLFAAVSAGLFALRSGAGPIAAIAVGFVAGVLTLALGQAVFTFVPSPIVRGLVALLFAAPAAFAGFHAMHGLAALAVPSDGWRQILAFFGGRGRRLHRAGRGYPSRSSRRPDRQRPEPRFCRPNERSPRPNRPGRAGVYAIVLSAREGTRTESIGSNAFFIMVARGGSGLPTWPTRTTRRGLLAGTHRAARSWTR